MVVCSTVALACYGLVLGFSNGLLQALASAIKLPVLFFLTLAICLPTLYLFNLLFGALLSVAPGARDRPDRDHRHIHHSH